MVIGTHNTMTYRSPKFLWMYLIRFMARCQGVSYQEQHEKYGADAFDFRIFWDKEGNIEFRHGLVSFDGSDFFNILRYCEKNGIIVRLLFEERNFKSLKKRSKEMNLEDRFLKLCIDIEKYFPNLKIYGGRNTRTWEVIYKFKMDDPNEYGYYSSVTSLFKSKNKFLKVIDDLYPRLYAKLKNKKHKIEKIEEHKNDENGIVQFDFIEIG